MSEITESVVRMMKELEKLPGIGKKSSERITYHILKMSKEDALELCDSIRTVKERVRYCKECYNLSEEPLCDICRDPSRDRSTICVVESPKDVLAMEKIREYRGYYHVLHGVISPMDQKGPEDINLKSLITRLQDTDVKELIIATNPTIEGEATAVYIARLIKPSGIKVSRIAHGIPVGGDLEYADEVTLLKAIEGRREL